MKTGIFNAKIVNEGKVFTGSVLIEDGRIAMITESSSFACDRSVNAEGLLLVPGVIDDQVHFREPGFTHKAEIATESRAAVAGGVTSYMEMPNTNPQAVTQEELAKKYARAAEVSLANYSFFMGGTNDNLEEIVKTDPKTVCGIKLFMGSSTGNMLVDDEDILEKIFANAPTIIATHCEDEDTVRTNLEKAIAQFGEDIPAHYHPIIRNHQACLLSSQKASKLARENNARLHILHLTTADELPLFDVGPLKDKRITSEVCVHHLTFSDADYQDLGHKIKCNPAIKTQQDQDALWKALLEDRIDVIATDHAPHTLEEKNNPYTTAPAGLPLIQHPLLLMLEHSVNGKIPLERVIEKMCHAPADLFDVHERGYIREGYWADLVLVDPNNPLTVSKDQLLYKCGWSPLEGRTFSHRVHTTFINGYTAYSNGTIFDEQLGKRLTFDR
jgi:dihydroorotase